MTTLTGQNTRTITGYLTQLLVYPRWYIEREVDFTHCHLSGGYDDAVNECVECRFGEACQWLNRNRSATTDAGEVGELVAALQTALEFVSRNTRHDKGCSCESCSWLREARQFLHSRRY